MFFQDKSITVQLDFYAFYMTLNCVLTVDNLLIRIYTK